MTFDFLRSGHCLSLTGRFVLSKSSLRESYSDTETLCSLILTVKAKCVALI